MSTRINTNTTAAMAAQNLSMNSDKVSQNIQRLSSGLRINSAADDAAGLVISNSLSAQSAGLTQATRNTNDAINVVKTAGSALGQVNTLLTNIRQLILHAANVGANNTTASQADQQAIEQAVNSIQRISQTTQFNGKNLLQGDGTGAGTGTNGTLGLLFQVGANGGQTVSTSPSATPCAPWTLGSDDHRSDTCARRRRHHQPVLRRATAWRHLGRERARPALDVSSANTANADVAPTPSRPWRSWTRPSQGRVDRTGRTLGASPDQRAPDERARASPRPQQNIRRASQSTIRDADLASQVVDYTKNQILVQAGTSALAQANSAPQAILKLLG